jgi:hypothetical protein
MENYLEVVEFDTEGYDSLIAYEEWRVAMLNYIDELEPLNIDNFQKHDLTDEVFVLLNGKCILFFADVVDNKIKEIIPVDMEPFKVYNVKKGIYHTHTLSKDAKVLIVENDNTDDDNSPKIMIDEPIQKELKKLTDQLW